MSSTRHVPVLLEECLHHLQPRPGRVIADLTLGGGGHTAAILQLGARVLGFDRDGDALERAQTRFSPHEDQFTPVHRGFGALEEVLAELGLSSVDGVLMDLGLSSDQLDDARRGFAHRLDGPLDLRFDPSSGVPASDRLESADVSEIARWLRDFGEIRSARRLARRMADASRRGELRTTAQLRELVVEQAHPRHREAELSRVFQALRILVNEELEQLDRILEALPRCVAPGGRFVAISYHSLEDRRVKRMLRAASGRAGGGSRHLPAVEQDEPTFRELTRRVVRPDEEEIRRNPRARSARLRAAERL